jgi:CheY-like chemotaxis protein
MSQIRILVVEDEGIVAADIQDLLIRLGYRCVTASSAEGALQDCRNVLPTLVLMDIMLRGRMDGVEAALEIRKQFGNPVVFLTAHTDGATLERAKTAEPFGYLIKPFEAKDVQSMVERALQIKADLTVVQNLPPGPAS